MAGGYTLSTQHKKPAERCKCCRHPHIGYHASERCEGLSEGGSHLCMVVSISEKGVARCHGLRTHSLSYRLSRSGARLYEAIPARRQDDAPLYCPEHATQLAITLTIQSRQERAA